jgi:hypothetical protein
MAELYAAPTIAQYQNETAPLYRVLDTRLASGDV